MPLDPVTSVHDLRSLLATMPDPDQGARGRVLLRDQQLTKPPGSLGRLDALAPWLASWQGHAPPRLRRRVLRVFAGSHGVAKHGVSAYPPEVTGQMVHNFRAGGAAINQLCDLHDLDLEVVDLGWDRPTHDFTERPAMSTTDMLRALTRGIASVPADADVIALGEMGIGNTTSAAAVYAALWGGSGQQWVGRGTGVDDDGLARKARTVDAGLRRHAAACGDPWEVLRRLGGLETAAMAGAILAARHERVPVVLDGFVSTAAAAVLQTLEPGSTDHCVAGHVSAESAHREVLVRLGLTPLLDLDLRLGEGTGAALAIGLLAAAVATHAGMATFAEAGVATASEPGPVRDDGAGPPRKALG